MIKFKLLSAITLCSLLACNTPKEEKTETITTNSSIKVVKSSEIVWEQLNPARGDQSPLAGTVWGDRKANVPTGFLAKFVDGFSSPPHIHNVTYRAMVVSGLVHNDDPAAEKMWMPAGSFWTQPAGEAHITAVKGKENIAYVEIDQGPYLVKPTNKAFDAGEKPVNITKNNMVWQDSSLSKLIEVNGQTPLEQQAKITLLWDNKNLNGRLIKLPANFKGSIVSDNETFYAVVITGEANYELKKGETPITLDPGSYFSSENKATHTITTGTAPETLIYIRSNGNFVVKQH
ncbi:DUF4437 domain-containing protein [Wenyingzhuangia sp. IMCC45574]